MKIPHEFQTILNEDPKLLGYILLFLENTKTWVTQSGCVFFPEYTRHDYKHSEEVLQTAADLTTQTTLRLLTPADIAALVGAVALHDSAMHLTEDGFQTLIAPDSIWRPLQGFDDKPWHLSWDQFVSSVMRYDAERLVEILGSPEPPHRIDNNWQYWNDRDRRLIGEFIRINHARLASEIAMYGVPGPDGAVYNLFPTVGTAQKQLAALSGLIARSHGTELRKALDHVAIEYNSREYNGIHTAYLMSLLRVADILQIQPERAPETALNLRKLKSPLSANEWAVHGCIEQISNTEDDPEAIYVKASPPNPQIFHRVKLWIDAIQNELDQSWASLGEIYGSQSRNNLDQLGIKLRRIYSNLDDSESFSNKAGYLPEQIQFTTAGTELIQLLIGPLYSEDIPVGLRELIQNSVDAVRELKLLKSEGITGFSDCLKPNEPEILVTLVVNEEGLPEALEVEDFGVGMDAEILKHHFLNVGASFRNSLVWKQMFTVEDDLPKLMRSGKFGVGAMAAFLLGDKISVSTRRFNEPPDRGLSFEAELFDQFIDVRFSKREIGTKIRIELNELAKTAFISNENRPHRWYFMNDPILEYRCIEEKNYNTKVDQFVYRMVPTELCVPNKGSEPGGSWASIEASPLEEIKWCYRSWFTGIHASVFCNGIPISDSTGLANGPPDKTPYAGYSADISRRYDSINLTVSIIDQKGILPVTLARDQVSHGNISSTIEQRLNEAVARDQVFGALYGWPYAGLDREIGTILESLSELSTIDRSYWALSALGATISEPSILKVLNMNSLILASDRLIPFIHKSIVDLDLRDIAVTGFDNGHILHRRLLDSRDRIDYLMRLTRGRFEDADSNPIEFVLTNLGGATADLTKDSRASLQQINQSTDGWFNFHSGQSDARRELAQHLIQNLPPRDELRTRYLPLVFSIDLNKSARNRNPRMMSYFGLNTAFDDAASPVHKAWIEIIGKQFIPFDAAARELIVEKHPELKDQFHHLRPNWAEKKRAMQSRQRAIHLLNERSG